VALATNPFLLNSTRVASLIRPAQNKLSGQRSASW